MVMTRTPYSAYRTRPSLFTAQSHKMTENQVPNNAGGFVNKIDPWKQLERFLILGTEGGTYYVGESKLTIENAKSVHKLVESDGVKVVERVIAISESGRAAKADPCLFVLALCVSFGDAATKRAVRDNLPRVARIGTHLFTFVEYAEQFRGWGRVLRETVANWYLRHGTDAQSSKEDE